MFDDFHLVKLIVPPTISIRFAARAIQDVDSKILLVCDSHRRLLGTVTDGDIRRAVSESRDLDLGVDTIMNRRPKVAGLTEPEAVARARMRATTIRHMPRVDREGRVVALLMRDKTNDLVQRRNAAVLMAGGRGSRLIPLTDHTPKPLLKVGAKSIIERQIELLIDHGFCRFYVSVNYLAQMIEDYLQDGAHLGVEIRYLREDKPLGTSGSLGLLESQEEPIVVLNGDIITKANFSAMLDYLAQTGVAATMGVREHSYTVPFGCVHMEGDRIARLEEKPTFWHMINAGVYVLAPEALDHIPPGRFFDMPELFGALIDAGKHTNTFLISEEWIDIGRKEDLLLAQRNFAAEYNFNGSVKGSVKDSFNDTIRDTVKDSVKVSVKDGVM
jgi:dTDP-glucose pyrophosphorylase